MKCPSCGFQAPNAAFGDTTRLMAEEPLRVFVGWDSREPVAFSVLAHSILARATRPVAIIPLTRRALTREYTRPRGPTEATEFSLLRFLVPYLSGYKGHSIFMDCDMLCRVDIGDVFLYTLADPGKAVYCCQHDYVPKGLTKFLGQEQTAYPRKNWSSFLIFDNAQCKTLTPEYVNRASGLELHRLMWAGDAIGALPLTWNWLVGEYAPNADARMLHYTQGGPYFSDYRTCDQADLWWNEYAAMAQPTATVGVEAA